MWLYNVVRAIFISIKFNVLPDNIAVDFSALRQCIEEAGQCSDPGAVYVLKSHLPMSISGDGVRIVTALRDPRDMAVSYRDFCAADEKPVDIEATIEQMLYFYDCLATEVGDAVFQTHYVDIVTRPTEVVSALRAAFGLPPDAAQDERIAADFSPDAVRRIIAENARDRI